MSNPVLSTDEARTLMPAHVEPPRMEPWLRVMGSSLAPAVAIIFVPQPVQIPLAIVSGLLLVAGTAILIAERLRRRDPTHR